MNGIPLFNPGDIPADLLDCFEEVTVECGAPWRRVVEERGVRTGTTFGGTKYTKENGSATPQSGGEYVEKETKTTGWEPTCSCFGKLVKKKKSVYYGSWSDRDGLPDQVAWKDGDLLAQEIEKIVSVYVPDIPLKDHPVIPCVVLDPFIGSGTTAAVSLSLGRRSVGIDLSQTYLEENAITRIEGAILQRPALKKLMTKEVKKVSVGKRLETRK